jgi:hypothetical protein
MNDPRETPARRRKAREWYDKLVAQAEGWGNGGRTVAETAGVTVDPKAPGGQKIETGGGYAGVSRNREDVPYEGEPLSTELHSGQRQGHWRTRQG